MICGQGVPVQPENLCYFPAQSGCLAITQIHMTRLMHKLTMDSRHPLFRLMGKQPGHLLVESGELLFGQPAQHQWAVFGNQVPASTEHPFNIARIGNKRAYVNMSGAGRTLHHNLLILQAQAWHPKPATRQYRPTLQLYKHRDFPW